MYIIRKGYIVFHLTIVLLLFVNLCACNDSAKKNDTTEFLDYKELDFRKEKLKKGDKKQIIAFENLIKTADSLLNGPVFSVMHKIGVPPSGDKHDYMSIGPYWWPNLKAEDKLPYIRKDGEINPEARNNYTDFKEKEKFISAIKTLNKAYYLSDEKKYADKNLKLINTWFLNKDTKMNPNVNYGQYIPGKTDGRCFGIIEFGGLTEVIKFLELAKVRNVLDKKTEESMYNWFTKYSNWLRYSELGIKEGTRKNNHGTHYDVQLLNILLYLNRIDEVKEYLSTITKARIFQQIEPDGSQPKELARTKSYSYTVMNLNGFLELAVLGKKVGINLWEMESDDGRSIKKAYQYMLPYLTQEKKWEYKQIKDKTHSENNLISNLKRISRTFKDTSFNKITEL